MQSRPCAWPAAAYKKCRDAGPLQCNGAQNAMPAFLRAVARLGAAGRAARWTARLYHCWHRLAPEDTVQLDSFITTLIASRYDIDALIRPEGCSQHIRTALATLHDAGRIRGICHLVVLMLAAEGDFADTDADVQTAFVEAVGAELTDNGVPAQLAYGTDLHARRDRLCAIYRPSIRLLTQLLRC